ncbi:MAG: hypothetical protein ACXVHX_22750 [Solirubrobacteraceae bacterium]
MLTPEQARDLAEHFGGNRAAARAIGAHESTVRYWLNPEPKREQARARYDGLSGSEYNRLLLRRRRTKALKRRAQRTRKGD